MAMTEQEKKDKQREYNKKYYQKHRESELARRKAYREKHPEKTKAYNNEYCKRDSVRQRQKEYFQNNKERIYEQRILNDEKYYATMVCVWLREMAHNNYKDDRQMNFVDAILDIRERAETGLQNYFRDHRGKRQRQ